MDGPVARNLRREGGGKLFYREPANICSPRNDFFLNRVISLWNELPQKVRQALTLDSFKAGLDRMKSFLT